MCPGLRSKTWKHLSGGRAAATQSFLPAASRQQYGCVLSKAQSPHTLRWVPELDSGHLTSYGFPHGAAQRSSVQTVGCNQPVMARPAKHPCGSPGHVAQLIYAQGGLRVGDKESVELWKSFRQPLI